MKIGIIGCGKQAPKHISGLIESNNVDCITVADLLSHQSETLANRYDSSVNFSTIDSLFNDPDINGIIISTPTQSHFELCNRAIDARKPFLVEKPLTSTLSEARALLDSSKKNKIPGMVGYIYRFSPTYEKIFEVLNADDILGPTSHALFRIAGRGSHQAWKHNAKTNGGAISEMMVHMIDLAVWYFGHADKVSLLKSDLVRPSRQINGEDIACDAEDWTVAELRMKNGTRVLIQADMISPVFKQYAEINGNNGVVEGSIQPQYIDSLSLFEARGDYSRGYQPLNTQSGNNYVSQGQCFLDMVRTGNDPDRCSLSDAVEVMRIQDVLKKS